jgi:hypothetical protein
MSRNSRDAGEDLTRGDLRRELERLERFERSSSKAAPRSRAHALSCGIPGFTGRNEPVPGVELAATDGTLP